MGQWITIHFPQVRVIQPYFWARERKSYQTGGYLPFTVPVGADILPYEELRGMRQYALHPGYLLSAIAKDICEARGLLNSADALVALYLGNQDVVAYDENALPGLRFTVKPYSTINVGVLGGSRIRNRYALYKDVKRDIETQVKANIETAKRLDILNWIRKVRGSGEWNYKENKMKAPIFPPDFRSWNYSSGAAKSSFFYMDKFTYDNTQPNLLRYDDVSNINYGATGFHLSESIRTKKQFHVKELLDAGGIYQKYTDKKYIETISSGTKFFLSKASTFLFDRTSFGLISSDDSLKAIDAYLKKVNHQCIEAKQCHRNEIGDDPRDTFAIAWGIDNFR